MLLNYHIHQVQTPRMVITPEMKQSLTILQLSAAELGDYLQEQAAENPLIEIEWPQEAFAVRSGFRLSDAEDVDRTHNIPDRDETLEKWVMRQLAAVPCSPELRKTVAFFAGNLDDSGYLTIGVEEAGALLGLPVRLVEQGLKLLQAMEPAGIGARNLRECLLLQIARDPGAPGLAAEIASHYLEPLALGKLADIAKKTGTRPEEVRQALAYIQRLNPRPCASIGRFDPQHVVVDAEVIVHPTGRGQIAMNRDSIPRLIINEAYAKHVLSEAGAHRETRSYIREKWHAAQWLRRSVIQRNMTLQKVISAIVEEQWGFIAGGQSDKRPLKLESISEKIGLHASTVSRAVKNKYIATPRGVMELKSFFSKSIGAEDGAEISASRVKHRIVELVALEDKRHPLSDQEIARILQQEGITISRRTIAKYRQEERILPSSLRKNG